MFLYFLCPYFCLLSFSLSACLSLWRPVHTDGHDGRAEIEMTSQVEKLLGKQLVFLFSCPWYSLYRCMPIMPAKVYSPLLCVCVYQFVYPCFCLPVCVCLSACLCFSELYKSNDPNKHHGALYCTRIDAHYRKLSLPSPRLHVYSHCTVYVHLDEGLTLPLKRSSDESCKQC